MALRLLIRQKEISNVHIQSIRNGWLYLCLGPGLISSHKKDIDVKITMSWKTESKINTMK